MVELDPDNMKWRMETQYADANLGILLLNQRRFADSAAQFENALRTIEAIATADPGNSDYQKSLAESLAWLADAKSSQGRIDEATALRERDVALLERLFKQSGGDVDYGQMLVPAHRALARLYFVRGRLELAIAQVREAVSHSEQLLGVERTNSQWLDFSANARVAAATMASLVVGHDPSVGDADGGGRQRPRAARRSSPTCMPATICCPTA